MNKETESEFSISLNIDGSLCVINTAEGDVYLTRDQALVLLEKLPSVINKMPFLPK